VQSLKDHLTRDRGACTEDLMAVGPAFVNRAGMLQG
jgi:hypothetical protein